MLIVLADYLTQFHSGFHVFQYITLRAVLSVLTALSLSFVFGPKLIASLNRHNAGQNIRTDGPPSHYRKQGIPTMGGGLIIFSVLVSTFLWVDLGNRYVLIVLFSMLAFAVIGGVDDITKLRTGQSRGLSVRDKFAMQAVAGVVVSLLIYSTAELPVETQLIVPFFKDLILTMGAFFLVLTFLVIVGSSNAMNLSDGLDGLAVMPTVMIAGGLAVFAYASGHVTFSQYLGIPNLPLAGELAILCGAIIGSGLGFLWFNAYPAQMFMGDLGSLALGAALGTIAVLVRQEIVFLIMGGVLVAETISVFIQVGYFKLTGRRVFLMAPLHHHLEMLGWPEPRVIVRFWIITLILVLIGLSTLKIR